MRIFWLCLAWVSVGLAVLGAVLPVMPTVPFLLVAVWGFAKSSPRMRNRILRHPKFGPPIRQWLRNGAIKRRTKIIALAMMAMGVVVGVFFGLPLWVSAVQSAILFGVGTYLWTRPEQP